MKKIYTILGNKPFEDKLIEQLSSQYIPVGRFDVVNDEALFDIRKYSIDTLVVRENLADNAVAFYEFLKQVKLINPRLKVIALLQPRNTGDEYLYKVVELGIFDIINSGTRLADVIELALRESTREDVFVHLNEAQKERLSHLIDVTPVSAELSSHTNEEELLIEIDGELQLDKETQATSFKERYISGITQVIMPPDNEEKAPKIQLPDLTPNDLIEPIKLEEEGMTVKQENTGNSFGFNFPGMSNRAVEVLEENKEIDTTNIEDSDESLEFDLSETYKDESRHLEEVAQKIKDFDIAESYVNTPDFVEPKDTIENKPSPLTTQNKQQEQTPITFFLVSHRLQSSVAMQYATVRAKNNKVAYIETDSRNQVLEVPFSKTGVKYFWLAKGEKIEDLLDSIKSEQFDEIVLNTSNLMYLKTTKPKSVFCEIVQDREYAIEIRDRMMDYPKARIIVSYFEPDLISQKSLNKVYNRSSVRWVNTRIEEYNSRLNGKLLQNQSINELLKEV